MAGITLKETAASSVPTPATDKATLFLDSADALPKYKDDAGSVHSLKGDPGTGDVDGPGSSVANRIAVFADTTGKELADGGKTIADLNRIEICVACSDESTALTTGTAKVTFRTPCAITLTSVRASLKTAQTSGSIFTVDINEGGTTVLSTKLTIDNTEKTSTTAATAAVISDTSLADDAEITVDIDQVGDGTAKGLKVWLIGTRT